MNLYRDNLKIKTELTFVQTFDYYKERHKNNNTDHCINRKFLISNRASYSTSRLGLVSSHLQILYIYNIFNNSQ